MLILEERCGRIRVFVSEARERVFQKLLECAAVYEEVIKMYCTHIETSTYVL